MKKSFWKIVKEGFEEAQKFELTKRENWIPIFIYLHVSRMILGAILGIIMGICITSLFFLISPF